MNHIALVPDAVYDLPHLKKILKVDGFVQILFVLLVLVDETQSAEDFVSLVFSFGTEVDILLGQNPKL